MAYEPRKAAQVVAALILHNRGDLNTLKAVKLVYLIDRLAIEKRGSPVLDEARYSMPHGPVNSSTYNLIKGEEENKAWSELLRDERDHAIALAKENISFADLDELSEAELTYIAAVWKKFGRMNQWELRDWTHNPKNLPEWEDPHGSSSPIPLRRIMRDVGIGNAEACEEEYEAIQAVSAHFVAAE